MSDLFGIKVAPSAENIVILLHSGDNVGVARVHISSGSTVRVGGEEFVAKDNVPPGHKIALRPVREREQVIRYGQRIGRASRDIETGQHVHTHNLSFEEIEFAYEYPEKETAIPVTPADGPSFPRLRARRRARGHS